MQNKYIIITPVRNEQDHIEKMIASVVSQKVAPVRWIVVNDGSTDKTGGILDEASSRHKWISIVHRKDRGYRKSGGGVIEAFYDGYQLVQNESFDFIAKLDGDLAFGTDYFELCLRRFEKDPKLGVGGGMICKEQDGALIEEWTGDPPFHVRGATKIYRRACWNQIAPLVSQPGWDTIDELRAKIHGWNTYTFRDIKIAQLKPTGSADGGWKNWVKNGLANYNTHYHPLFMLAKCGARAGRKPYLVGGLGLLYGFMKGYLRKHPRPEDPELHRYVRRQQMNRLLGRPNIWQAK